MLMTDLLEQAIEKLKQLSPVEQDMLASRLLEEVAEMDALREKIALGMEQGDRGEVVPGSEVFDALREKASAQETR